MWIAPALAVVSLLVLLLIRPEAMRLAGPILLMWLLAFLTVGSEWFLMWQSKVWNGQEAAARGFNVAGILLLYLVMPDVEGQP